MTTMRYACKPCGPSQNYRHIGSLFNHLATKHALPEYQHVENRQHVAKVEDQWRDIIPTADGWALKRQHIPCPECKGDEGWQWDEDENIVDCLACGTWFELNHVANVPLRVALHQAGLIGE